MFKVLVTGAVGFVGFHICTHLNKDMTLEVIGADSYSPATPTNLTAARGQLLQSAGVNVVQLDLTQSSTKELVSTFGTPDIVIHLAAHPGVRLTSIQSEFTFFNNSRSFEAIATYASVIGAKLIYASSSSVYGDNGLSGPCSESSLTKFAGKGAYASSKWANEQFALDMLQGNKLESLGLRFFSIFGNYGREDMAYFDFAKRIMRDETLKVFNSLEDKRDYTHIDIVVSDVTKIVIAILEQNNFIKNEILSIDGLAILNIGTGLPRSLKELLDLYQEFFQKIPKLDLLPRLDVESRTTWSDNSKRNRVFGIRETISFEENILSFARWAKDNYDNFHE